MAVPQVAVIGGANLDVRAMSAQPLVRETSNPGSVKVAAGGVARNIAHFLAKLGVATALISAVGKDSNGDRVLDETTSAGVDTTAVLRLDAATGLYSAILDSDGALSVAVNAMGIIDELKPDVLAVHQGLLKEAQFVIADCNLRIDALLWLAERFGAKLIVDPVSIPKCGKVAAMLHHSSLFGLTPNRAQVEALTGIACTTSETAAAAARKLHKQGVRNAILHLDKNGVLVSQMNSAGETELRHLPSVVAAKRKDVTGGGDAAIAGLVYGLLTGHELFAAAGIGQRAAALVLAGDGVRLGPRSVSAS